MNMYLEEEQRVCCPGFSAAAVERLKSFPAPFVVRF